MSKREEMRNKRQQARKRQRTLTILVVAACALLLVAALTYPSWKPQVKTNPRPQASGNSMGNPSAPVKVEEFSDYQCPYCRVWWKEMEPQLVKDYVETGKVYFTYIPFSFLGQESVDSAEAAFCAMDQGKFWEYHDLIFENQAGENAGTFNAAKLARFASDLKLNPADFKTCTETHKYSEKVKQDVEYGKKVGVKGTPSFTVNGKLVDSYRVLDTIQAELKAKGG